MQFYFRFLLITIPSISPSTPGPFPHDHHYLMPLVLQWPMQSFFTGASSHHICIDLKACLSFYQGKGFPCLHIICRIEFKLLCHSESFMVGFYEAFYTVPVHACFLHNIFPHIVSLAVIWLPHLLVFIPFSPPLLPSFLCIFQAQIPLENYLFRSYHKQILFNFYVFLSLNC